MTLPCKASGRTTGFTLIEVIVTLAILGLALVLVAGFRAPWSTGLGLKGAAAELASGLRLARSEAILRNRAVPFELDVAGRRYRIGNGTEHRLPTNLVLGLLTVAGEQRREGAGDIRFNPDGSSTGGRIVLAAGQQRMAVGVDWLTGRISIAEIR
jgi:general secretion pathway protein H